jgi:ribosomal protein S16
MVVKIRLTQRGKKHQRSYRIIAVDSRKPRDTGKYLEELGSCHYNPRTKKIEFNLKDKDKENIKK